MRSQRPEGCPDWRGSFHTGPGRTLVPGVVQFGKSSASVLARPSCHPLTSNTSCTIHVAITVQPQSSKEDPNIETASSELYHLRQSRSEGSVEETPPKVVFGKAPYYLNIYDLEDLLGQLSHPFLLLGDFTARHHLLRDTLYSPR